MSQARREIIEATIEKMVADLLHYDRKEDEELPRGAIEEAIEQGEITKEDMVRAFEAELDECLE